MLQASFGIRARVIRRRLDLAFKLGRHPREDLRGCRCDTNRNSVAIPTSRRVRLARSSASCLTNRSLQAGRSRSRTPRAGGVQMFNVTI